MHSSLALQIQRLGGFNEQVLVLLHIAELRSQGGAATPAAVAELFRALRLRPPSNERQHLVQLRQNGLVMQPAPGEWAVTPEGRETITRLMGELPTHEIAALKGGRGEPVFAGAAHHLLPPEVAPSEFQAGIARFLEDSAFDRNVFCITRYPASEAEPLAAAIGTCRHVCADFGLQLHLATDRALHDEIYRNVGVHMWSCAYGIVILEKQEGRPLNYNVFFETGGMLMTGRRCLILRDITLEGETLPTDIVGRIYKPIDVTDGSSIARAVREWITSDLGLA